MLATLLDRTEGDAIPLPPPLAERYGGPLRFSVAAGPRVFSNFVSTIDGIVSFDRPGEESAALVSRGHAADRFILALLRAVADAVIVGAGTLRKEPTSVWTAESVFPEAGGDFASLRKAMRKPPRPLTVLVSESGELDLRLPALAEGAPVLVLTGERGASRLEKAPPHVRVQALESTAPRELVRATVAAARGSLILTEGGPTLLGQFVRDGALDDIFLTIAPLIGGRSSGEKRIAMIEGVAFGAKLAPVERLHGVKVAEDYLFLRFARR